jgi:hypothetical protein
MLKDYVYKLDKNLEYMFYHLTPEDNYSQDAYNKVIADSEKMVQFGMDIDGIRMTMVTKDGVVAAINLSEEGVKIKGTKISLEGVVTANNYFKINLDGSMEATNGTFTGTISGTTVTGGTISGTTVTGGTVTGTAISGGSIDIKRGSNIGLYCNGNQFRFGDFKVVDWYGRQTLQSIDEQVALSADPDDYGQYFAWFGWDDSKATDRECTLGVKNDGSVLINGALYYNGQSLRSFIEEVIDDYGGGPA